VLHVSDRIDGDDHSLSPRQPTDRITDSLDPAVLLNQLLMPQRGPLGIQDPGRRVDPYPIGVAAHIARHDSDLEIVTYPLHLAGVHERLDVQRAVFFGKPHQRRHGLAGFPVGFQAATSHFTTSAKERQIARFFLAHAVPSAARTVPQCLERIRINSRWLTNTRVELTAWFKAAS
jgi:hypothetical protein